MFRDRAKQLEHRVTVFIGPCILGDQSPSHESKKEKEPVFGQYQTKSGIASKSSREQNPSNREEEDSTQGRFRIAIEEKARQSDQPGENKKDWPETKEKFEGVRAIPENKKRCAECDQREPEKENSDSFEPDFSHLRRSNLPASKPA